MITFLINITYALPLGILALGSDFFILFFWLIVSSLSALFFYFKKIKLLYKICIFILIIFSFFPIRYLYLENQKENILNEYIKNIKNLWLSDLYYDFWYLISKYDKSVTQMELIGNLNNYYILDIRERSEYFWLEKKYSFQHIRFPNLIKNHNEIFKNIKKPILITCIDWERWRIISSFLWNLWYNSYYLKWWLSWLNINFWHGVNTIFACKKNTIWMNFFIWLDDKNKNTIDIAYMQLTEYDIKNIIKYFEKNNILSKQDNIILFCNKNKWLNCWVGRQSFGLLLKDLGYKDICLWE